MVIHAVIAAVALAVAPVAANALTYAADYSFTPNLDGSGAVSVLSNPTVSGTVAANTTLAAIETAASAGDDDGSASTLSAATVEIVNPGGATSVTLGFEFGYLLDVSASGLQPSATAFSEVGLGEVAPVFDDALFEVGREVTFSSASPGGPISTGGTFAFSRTIDPGQTLVLTIDAITEAAVFNSGFADSRGFASIFLDVETVEVAPIPLPAAAWLLLGGLGALRVAARRRA